MIKGPRLALSSATQHAMPKIRRKVGNGSVLMENEVSKHKVPRFPLSNPL